MPADFLQSLLQGELESSPSDPNTADRNAQLNAITQYIRAGNTEPVRIENPAYGPVGSVLQSLGLRSRYRPVTPQMSNEMWLGGQIQGQEKSADQMKKLGAIQDFGTQFGTEPARKLSGTIGAPEIGEDLPTNVKGMGELREQDRINKVQAMMNSLDIATQRQGMQEAAMLSREFVASGKLDLANQVAHMTQTRITDAENKSEQAPLNQMGHSLLSSIDSQEGQLIKQRADLIASGQDESSAAVQYLDKERNALLKRRMKLFKIQGTAKTPADYGALYDDSDESAQPQKGKVKPPAKSLSFD